MEMPSFFKPLHPAIETAAVFLELLGVAAVVIGVLLAGGIFLKEGFEHRSWTDAYERFRANLGRGILIGLELLVGADIIATVTAPLTLQSVGLLAVIVLIRTFLSFSLETEIEGRWPWMRWQSEEHETR